MNANSMICHEDDFGYECPGVRQRGSYSERTAMAASRIVTGQERVSRQARYSRRSTPQRLSGTHRRGNNRYGI